MLELNKSTRYALFAAMELAQAGPRGQVTAAQVAERYGIPAAVLAKVFQRLVRGRIAIGIRGAGGGYRLARRPSKVTLLDVIESFEPPRERRPCPLDGPFDEPCRDHGPCRLRSLFGEVEEVARSTFASITLETLVGRPRPGMGLQIVAR
jgi:Rrf2 family protein